MAKKVWKALALLTMMAAIWARICLFSAVFCSVTAVWKASRSKRRVSCLALSDFSFIHRELPAKAMGLFHIRLQLPMYLTPVEMYSQLTICSVHTARKGQRKNVCTARYDGKPDQAVLHNSDHKQSH